jgi:3-oxoacyl-[acyl-carrier protein] reductase
MTLNDKVVFITGAANGIGKQLAKDCYKRGASIVATDLTVELLEAAASERASRRSLILPLNVADAKAWKQAIDRVMQQFGRIDILLNVAGIIEPGYIHETTLEKIDRQIDINLKGTIYGVHAVAPIMQQQGSGHIINFGSLAALAPVPGLNIYSASKFGVRGFSLAIAQELDEFGIAVSVVCPDAVNTPMLDYQKDKKEAALTFSGDKVLTTEDIGKAVLELIEKPKPEVWLPASRATLAMASNLFPGVAKFLKDALMKKGLKNQEKFS